MDKLWINTLIHITHGAGRPAFSPRSNGAKLQYRHGQVVPSISCELSTDVRSWVEFALGICHQTLPRVVWRFAIY